MQYNDSFGGGLVTVPMHPEDPLAGNIRFSFDSQGYTTGFSVSITGSSGMSINFSGGTLVVPPNTSIGAQWLSDDSAQLGFTNPVFVKTSGAWPPNFYFGKATYSDLGNGRFTSVTGSMFFGDSNSISGLLTLGFNQNDAAGDVGNDLITLMNRLHDNTTCADVPLLLNVMDIFIAGIGLPGL